MVDPQAPQMINHQRWQQGALDLPCRGWSADRTWVMSGYRSAHQSSAACDESSTNHLRIAGCQPAFWSEWSSLPSPAPWLSSCWCPMLLCCYNQCLETTLLMHGHPYDIVIALRIVCWMWWLISAHEYGRFSLCSSHVLNHCINCSQEILSVCRHNKSVTWFNDSN